MRQADRVKLGKYLEEIEKRVFPMALAVYFPNLSGVFAKKQHSFWMFNQIVVQQADFAGRSQPLTPDWLLVLVVDVRSGTALFSWGYQLDPYIDVNRINSSIIKARLLLRDGLLVQGIRKVMKDAVRQIALQGRKVMAKPERYGVIKASNTGAGKEEAQG